MQVFSGETANAITMFVGCSDAGVTSTLTGDVVRTVSTQAPHRDPPPQ